MYCKFQDYACHAAAAAAAADDDDDDQQVKNLFCLPQWGDIVLNKGKINKEDGSICVLADMYVHMHICVWAARWGQGNMRDILFQHIPSGADLMTRDLKMYCTW